MVDASGGTCLVDEAVDILFVIDEFVLKHLQRDRPVQRELPCQKNLSHSPLAERFFNQEITDYRSRRGRGFGEIDRFAAFRAVDLSALRRLFRFKNISAFRTVDFHDFRSL